MKINENHDKNNSKYLLSPCEETAFQEIQSSNTWQDPQKCQKMHFNTQFGFKSVSNQWKSMEIMTGSQAQTYVPREREDSVLEGTTRTGKGAYMDA